MVVNKPTSKRAKAVSFWIDLYFRRASRKNGTWVPGLASKSIDNKSGSNKYLRVITILSDSSLRVDILNISLLSSVNPNIDSPTYSPLKSITKNWDFWLI